MDLYCKQCDLEFELEGEAKEKQYNCPQCSNLLETKRPKLQLKKPQLTGNSPQLTAPTAGNTSQLTMPTAANAPQLTAPTLSNTNKLNLANRQKKVEESTATQAELKTCTNCHAQSPLEAKLCVNCGHFFDGGRARTIVKKKPKSEFNGLKGFLSASSNIIAMLTGIIFLFLAYKSLTIVQEWFSNINEILAMSDRERGIVTLATVTMLTLTFAAGAITWKLIIAGSWLDDVKELPTRIEYILLRLFAFGLGIILIPVLIGFGLEIITGLASDFADPETIGRVTGQILICIVLGAGQVWLKRVSRDRLIYED